MLSTFHQLPHQVFIRVGPVRPRIQAKVPNLPFGKMKKDVVLRSYLPHLLVRRQGGARELSIQLDEAAPNNCNAVNGRSTHMQVFSFDQGVKLNEKLPNCDNTSIILAMSDSEIVGELAQMPRRGCLALQLQKPALASHTLHGSARLAIST